MDNKIIQLLPDGTLTVTEPIENGEKTVRYFDSRLQMILNIVEKTKDKTIITKYMPDGHFIQSITVETKDSFTVYAPDGKTKQREKRLAPDGNETGYQKNGKTQHQTAVFAPNGTVKMVVYQQDGKTKTQEIYQDDKGLSKTHFFAADGQTLLKTSEDLSDGSTRTVYYHADSGVAERVETGPLKGESAANVYLIETYDESGKKIVSSEKQSR